MVFLGSLPENYTTSRRLGYNLDAAVFFFNSKHETIEARNRVVGELRS